MPLPLSKTNDDPLLAPVKQTRLIWVVWFLCWAALVSLTASSIFVMEVFPFQFALQMALSLWSPYALAAPIVFYAATRFPLSKSSWKRSFGVHVFGAILFVLVCEGSFAKLIIMLEREARDIIAEKRLVAEKAGMAAPFSILAPPPIFDGGYKKPTTHLIAFKSQFSLPLYCVLVGIAHAIAAMTALREREKQAAQLAAHLAQAQLARLRTQLHPHFLFNTLNSIAALIPQNSKLATEMVMNLSDLLRMTLREPQRGEIRLSEELTILRHYVDIQRLRFGERLVFRVEATEEALQCFTPPLLLQPLVENAIRHGVEASEYPENVTVGAVIQNGGLLLEVVNSCSLGTDDLQRNANSTGLGLANTQARLKVQYGDQQQFLAGPIAGGGFRVAITIPARFSLTTALPPNHEN